MLLLPHAVPDGESRADLLPPLPIRLPAGSPDCRGHGRSENTGGSYSFRQLASDDLARVQTPLMVIMGEDDPANAPDRHAQFIAAHIPGAELWIPKATGHNVHLERPDEWAARVIDFLARRE